MRYTNRDFVSEHDISNLRSAYAMMTDAALAGDELAGAYFALCARYDMDPFPEDDDAFDDAEVRPF